MAGLSGEVPLPWEGTEGKPVSISFGERERELFTASLYLEHM